jgi:hypothetical protein
MFKETSTYGSLNAITCTESYLNDRAKKKYNDTTEWFNQFRKHITYRIDEKIFSPLYCEDNGTPNAPVRQIVAMLIIKESKGWSYSELLEHCEGNIFVRSALGLFNNDDISPCRKTLFNFLNRLKDWEAQYGEDLFESLFIDIGKKQILEFSVMGNKIRMDSTTLGSNIAWLTRYGIVHETLRLAYVCDKANPYIHNILPQSDLDVLKELTEETPSNVGYRSSNEQLESKIVSLGSIAYKIISNISDNSIDSIELLRRVFYEQYSIIDNNVTPLPKSELKSTNVQSPHDPDSHYLKKNDEACKGFTVNITETCHPDNLVNLITDVIVAPVTVHDSIHLIPAIEATEYITDQNIDSVNTDGAYHSVFNQEECCRKGVDFIISNLSGEPSKYDLEVDAEENLIVTDLSTGEIIPSIKIKRHDPEAPPEWKIEIGKGKYRKFTQSNVETNKVRKQINLRSKEEINIRNNVEATISQVIYPFSNDKSVYRRLFRNKVWAKARCMGINCRRIIKFEYKLDKLWKGCVQILILMANMGVLCSLLSNLFVKISNFMKKTKKIAYMHMLCMFSAIRNLKYAESKFEKTRFLHCAQF